jgi:hypothetical protein
MGSLVGEFTSHEWICDIDVPGVCPRNNQGFRCAGQSADETRRCAVARHRHRGGGRSRRIRRVAKAVRREGTRGLFGGEYLSPGEDLPSGEYSSFETSSHLALAPFVISLLPRSRIRGRRCRTSADVAYEWARTRSAIGFQCSTSAARPMKRPRCPASTGPRNRHVMSFHGASNENTIQPFGACQHAAAAHAYVQQFHDTIPSSGELVNCWHVSSVLTVLFGRLRRRGWVSS